MPPKKQYNLLDAIKIIAAFFIVCIHCRFQGKFGDVIIEIARFGVPFFFMVSGFFCYNNGEAIPIKKIVRKQYHILIIFLCAILIYFVSNIVNIFEIFFAYIMIKKLFSAKSVLSFILFNEVSLSGLLWFLPALIYVYGIFYVIAKSKFRSKSFILIPILIIGGIALSFFLQTTTSVPTFFTKSYVCRNYLFVGLPFFLSGYFINRFKDKILSHAKNYILIIVMLVSTFESVTAMFLFGHRTLYIGTAVAVIALFVFAIKNEDNIEVPYLSSLGRNYSLYIYVLHVAVRDTVNHYFGFMHINGNLIPIIAFLISLIIGALCHKIKITVKKAISTKKDKSEREISHVH